MLEFSIHPDSDYVQNNQIDLNKETVLFCAAGGRSALAAKTLQEMGFDKVSHIEGGFGLMKQNGFKVKQDGAILSASDVIGRQIDNVKITIDDIPIDIPPLVKSTVEIDCIYSDYLKISSELAVLEK